MTPDPRTKHNLSLRAQNPGFQNLGPRIFQLCQCLSTDLLNNSIDAVMQYSLHSQYPGKPTAAKLGIHKSQRTKNGRYRLAHS